jgi:cobalamin biosynthesis protein CobW
MAAKIPATVITGFLGAGKTSLIRHLIENNDGRRLAFLINEFGDLGIDRETLLGCGIEDCGEDDIVELANGCICCTVADDFLPAMETLLNREAPPDHIIIETSGLALPKPLVQAFNWPEIKAACTVDAVITVVDGPAVAAGRFAANPAAVEKLRRADASLDHDPELHELFEDQLSAADLVVMSKADLMDDEAMAEVAAIVRKEVPDAVKLVQSSGADLDLGQLLGREQTPAILDKHARLLAESFGQALGLELQY